MMGPLSKNWKVWLALVFFVLCIGAIAFKGVRYGIDFSGGTQFQIQLDQQVNDPAVMQQIVSTVQQRLDWTGLKDTKVNAWGNEFVIAQIGETDPARVERLESLLRRQGRFEVVFDGNVIFTGHDIIRITKDPAHGYGVQPIAGGNQWVLPFSLRDSAAIAFRDATWHACSLSTFDPLQGAAGRTYECEKTFFFIDRPEKAVLILPERVARADETKLLAGNPNENIPIGTTLGEVLQNAGVTVIRFSDANATAFSARDRETLLDHNTTGAIALVPASLASSYQNELSAIGYEVRQLPDAENDLPFAWSATGLRQIISLTESVVFLNTPDSQRLSTPPLTDLVIQGNAATVDEAGQRLKDLEILLESGSLPVGVASVSKETISPLLGERFLQNVVLMWFLAIVGIVVLLWIRYRNLNIVLPILATDIIEATGVVGLAAFFGWSIDLAGVAGILAAVGTGINDQIIIVDELLKSRGKDEDATTINLVERVRRAFFIIFAAAATLLATMLPLIVFGLGLGKLVGFAITTIVGVLVGIFITRPAFGEVAEWILEHEKKSDNA